VPGSGAPRSDLILFLLFFVTFGYFHQGGFANSNSRFDLSLALAFERSYTIDAFHANTIDKVRVGGRHYSEKAPGAAYAALPVLLAAALVLDTDDLRGEPGPGDLLLHLSTALSAGLLSALAAVAFRRLLRRINPSLSTGRATTITVAVYLGTPLFVYSTALFGHALAAAWLVIGLELGLTAAATRPADLRQACAAAFALGVAVLSEYPAALPALAAWAAIILLARDRRRVWLGAPAAVIPAALLMLHQAASFGSPFAVGYGQLDGTPFETGMARGLFGIALPSGTASMQLLFGGYRGLFVYAPILALALGALASWPGAERRRLALPLLAGAFALLLVISGYAYWQGGPAFGPRHLVPVIPLVGLGLAFYPAGRGWVALFGIIATVSIALNVVGTATTPYVSEFETAPLADIYPMLVRDGAISLNPVSLFTPAAHVEARWQQAAAHPWAAYNLGERLGLSGWASLFPLATLWAAGIVVVRRQPGSVAHGADQRAESPEQAGAEDHRPGA
jgi:hypothetical protein